MSSNSQYADALKVIADLTKENKMLKRQVEDLTIKLERMEEDFSDYDLVAEGAQALVVECKNLREKLAVAERKEKECC